MNNTEIRATARQNVVEVLMNSIIECDSPMKVGDGEFAVREEVDGQEVWVTIKVTAKNWKDTKATKAYNPKDKAAEWEIKKQIKEKK